MDQGIAAINEQIKQESEFIRRLVGEIGKVIVGQRYLIERLLIGLLADGHVLIEGVPGLAKTLSVKTLAAAIQTSVPNVAGVSASQRYRLFIWATVNWPGALPAPSASAAIRFPLFAPPSPEVTATSAM